MMISKQALLFLSSAFLSGTHAAGGGLRAAPTMGEDPRKLQYNFGEHCNSDADCPSYPQDSYCGYWKHPMNNWGEIIDRPKMCCPGDPEVGVGFSPCITADPTSNPTAGPTGNPTAAPTGNPTSVPTKAYGGPWAECKSKNDCWNGNACAYWSFYDDTKKSLSSDAVPLNTQ